jgi:DNA-directed RNA polymerase subunit M/transcription elongation factor TFIIS
VWKPIDNLKWQSQGLCADPVNSQMVDYFFSKVPVEKYAAKNLCFSCPVRKDCLQWALENKQIWGVWGGKDEVEIRRALSVSYRGEEARRKRFPNCPYCSARPFQLETREADIPTGGRWTVARIVVCTECNFSWRSRTSARAVDAHHQDRKDRLERKERARAKQAEKAATQKEQQRTKQSSSLASRHPEK